jgi:hypothetical protein
MQNGCSVMRDTSTSEHRLALARSSQRTTSAPRAPQHTWTHDSWLIGTCDRFELYMPRAGAIGPKPVLLRPSNRPRAWALNSKFCALCEARVARGTCVRGAHGGAKNWRCVVCGPRSVSYPVACCNRIFWPFDPQLVPTAPPLFSGIEGLFAPRENIPADSFPSRPSLGSCSCHPPPQSLSALARLRTDVAT